MNGDPNDNAHTPLERFSARADCVPWCVRGRGTPDCADCEPGRPCEAHLMALASLVKQANAAGLRARAGMEL